MEYKLPDLGEGIVEAELVEWLVAEGEEVRVGQALAEVLTDKATVELPSPFAGKIVELQGTPGEMIPVGDVFVMYETAANETKTRQDSEHVVAFAAPRHKQSHVSLKTRAARVLAGPAVRRRAREAGVDITQIQGSGPQGRVLLDDLEQAPAAPIEPPAGTNGKTAPPTPMHFQPGTQIPLRGLRRRIAERMVAAKQTVPHYSYIDECEVTELVRLRNSLRDSVAERGTKLTYLAFVVKAVCEALKEVPQVNASIDDDASEIIVHGEYHIGIAVDTPTGLVVPVIHHADRKSVVEIAAEIQRLTNDARSGNLKLEDLRGGTFSVTSIGSIGGLVSTPIVNHPEVGILGIGKIIRRPVYDDHGELRPADLMYLSFSFDHRIVDGAAGARFGNAIVRQLENPAPMLLG